MASFRPLAFELEAKEICPHPTSPSHTPDRCQVERPPPSLQITSNFLVFYGLSHGTTLKKKGVVVFLGQDQMGPVLPPVFGSKIMQFLLQVPILL